MTNEQIFKNDPITKAVDKCNKELEKFGLKVKQLKNDYKVGYSVETIMLDNGWIVTLDSYDRFTGFGGK